MSELSEKDLLLRALAEPRFRLIFIPFTHYNTVRFVKQLLAEHFPDRTAREIDLEQQTVATIIPKLEGLEEGILYFDNFQILLKSEHLRTYLNQRRDWLSARPVAYIAFVNKGENVPILAKGLKDLYSFRTLVLYDLEKEEETMPVHLETKSTTSEITDWGVKTSDLEYQINDLFDNWRHKLEQKEDEKLSTLLMEELMAAITRHPSVDWRFSMMRKIDALFGEAYPAIVPMHAQAILHYFFGWTFTDLANFKEAEYHYRQAIAAEQNEPRFNIGLGHLLNLVGKSDDALQVLEKFVHSSHAQADPIQYAAALNNIGAAWNSKGDYDKALTYFEQAFDIERTSLGETHPEAAAAHNNIGQVWANKGDYDKAVQHFEKALHIDMALFGEEHPNTARDYNNIGIYLSNKGDYEKAIHSFEKALSIWERTIGKTHPNIAAVLSNIGLAWSLLDDHDKAISNFEKSLEFDIKTFGEEHPSVAARYYNIGYAWFKKNDLKKAIFNYEKALAVLDKMQLTSHPYINQISDALAKAKNLQKSSNT